MSVNEFVWTNRFPELNKITPFVISKYSSVIKCSQAKSVCWAISLIWGRFYVICSSRQCFSVCKSPIQRMEQCLPSEMWRCPDKKWSGEFLWYFYFRTANHKGKKSKEIDWRYFWKWSYKVNIPIDAQVFRKNNRCSEGILIFFLLISFYLMYIMLYMYVSPLRQLCWGYRTTSSELLIVVSVSFLCSHHHPQETVINLWSSGWGIRVD